MLRNVDEVSGELVVRRTVRLAASICGSPGGKVSVDQSGA